MDRAKELIRMISMDDAVIIGFEEPTEYGKKLLIISSLCDFAKILKESKSHESQLPRSSEDRHIETRRE